MVLAETQILMLADLCGGILFVIAHSIVLQRNRIIYSATKTELLVVEYSL